MASRRTMISRDRQRTCASRKRTDREIRERQQQQSAVLMKLWKQARAEAKAAGSTG